MKEDKPVIGYLIEPELLERLERVSYSLHSGSDRERDCGHRLWLIINEVRNLPINEGELKCQEQ